MKIVVTVFLALTFFGCMRGQSKHHESKTLKIEQLTPNTFLHTSFIYVSGFGKVACNGMVVVDHGEALIFDTPATENASRELLHWLKTELQCDVKGVVGTHFHNDCLGGLEVFHENQIPSYASNKTIALVQQDSLTIPQHGFDGHLKLKVGEQEAICAFFGEGHTEDNIIGYFPSEKVLFGGCLVKSDGAGKGNLEDANIAAWSGTVEKVMAAYDDVSVVIPGHGATGGKELLQYTIAMFKIE